MIPIVVSTSLAVPRFTLYATDTVPIFVSRLLTKVVTGIHPDRGALAASLFTNITFAFLMSPGFGSPEALVTVMSEIFALRVTVAVDVVPDAVALTKSPV